MPSAVVRGAAFLIALSGLLASPAPAIAQRPNIVVLMTDDQTAESLRVMTNVQRLLAARGTSFPASFVSFSLCCPSRATFLTGQYAHNHGVLDNEPPRGGFSALNHGSTLPIWLRRAGYHTVHIGKYLNGYGLEEPREIPPGWDEWYTAPDSLGAYSYLDYTLNENGRLIRYGRGPAAYRTDVEARKAVDVIRRRTAFSKPLFLWVSFLAPHAGGPRDADDPPFALVGASPMPAPRHRDHFSREPLPRPASFNELDVSDKPARIASRPLFGPAEIAAIEEIYTQRLEALLAVDEAVRDVVDALRKAGELQNTVIVFTSDNGFFHGEHRLAISKVIPYEPSIRVPLVIRGPGFRPGSIVRELVANIDLAPTILDLAGANAPRPLDGRSILPLTRDPMLRWGRDLLLETDTPAVGIRTSRYVYVDWGREGAELYDLVSDPHQLSSLHRTPELARLQQELARRLARMRRCSGGDCRAGPRLRLAAVRRIKARGGRRCSVSTVRLGVTGPDLPWVNSVTFIAGRRIVARDSKPPFRAMVTKRSARATKFRARISLMDREVSLSRRVAPCSGR